VTRACCCTTWPLQRDARVLLHDVAEALARIRRFTRGRSFADYSADEMLRSAVERQLAIVGEALWRLRSIDAALVAEIREGDRIVAFRHVLVHGYAAVDDKLVWGIIESRLDAVEADARVCLAALDARSA
jgi:uncharacterized protein with HEPN domain